MQGQKLGQTMRLVEVLSHARWAHLTLALPHACQQLIRRGTQKPLAGHEFAYPLQTVTKSKVINHIRQGRGAVAGVGRCAPYLECSSFSRAAKSETLFNCMGSISLYELQFGLINDILAVGDRSLAGLLKKSANWLLCCIIESRPL